MKTRNVDKHKYRNYLIKAEEFFGMAKISYDQGKYNTTVVCCVHSAISASDALTVFYKGVRHAGDRHEDVVSLLTSLGIKDIQSKTRQLLALLVIKNTAEYEEKLMSESNAKDAIQNAERFLRWVKETLKS